MTGPMQFDSMRSLFGALGDPARDKAAGTYYAFPIITDDQLLNAYRGSWLPRKIVNIPAHDAVRKGWDWQAEQAQIELIEAEEARLGLWGKLLEWNIKRRLWGGAAIFIGTGDADLLEPLDVERVGKGGVKYLTVLSRVELSCGPLETDVLSENYHKPAYYSVRGRDIHPSRLVIGQGAPHPETSYNGLGTFGWGDSVLTAVMEAIKNCDSTAANIASLVFEANVDVFGVPEFLEQLADPVYEQRLLSRFGLVAVNKSVNRSIIKDATETFDRKQVSFGSLPDVLMSFLQMVSGASDIPATRLLGQTPGGLSSTGESDLRNYYDGISSMQKLEISPAIYRLVEALIRSALGSRPPEVHYNWSSLWQISDKERAEIGKLGAETIEILDRTGLIHREALEAATVNFMVENSVFPGLDSHVNDAPPVDFEAVEPEPVVTVPQLPGA